MIPMKADDTNFGTPFHEQCENCRDHRLNSYAKRERIHFGLSAKTGDSLRDVLSQPDYANGATYNYRLPYCVS